MPAAGLTAHTNPRVMEHMMTTARMHTGPIKLLLQVSVEMPVLKLNTSRHQDNL